MNICFLNARNAQIVSYDGCCHNGGRWNGMQLVPSSQDEAFTDCSKGENDVAGGSGMHQFGGIASVSIKIVFKRLRAGMTESCSSVCGACVRQLAPCL